MSNKYVPRFMAKAPAVIPATTPVEQTPSTTPAATPSRWAKDEDIYRISPKKQTLVNTSLPAKMAPVLAPATLSALTAQEKRTPQKSKEVALSSEDEFPTLGGKKATQVTQVTQVTSKTFSELSKAWATTQKEDEAKAKEEEKEALRLQQAKEAEEFVCGGVQTLSIRTKHLRYVNQRIDDEDDTENLTPPEDDDVDDLPYEEEEEEEEENDGSWNIRKHRDDLY
jgi:hypothetical protein